MTDQLEAAREVILGWGDPLKTNGGHYHWIDCIFFEERGAACDCESYKDVDALVAAARADAEARIEALEEALQPFASAYDDLSDYANEDDVELNELNGLTVRDIRLACVALADPPEQEVKRG